MRRAHIPGRLRTALGGLVPRRPAPIAALLGIGLAFGYAFSEETPVGRVRGRVVQAESQTPLPGVEVTLSPLYTEGDEEDRVRYAVSGEDGRFSLAHVPAGAYYASASTRAHSVSNAYLTVDEGGTAEPILALARSEPDIALAEHQHVYGTAEAVHLPLRGYVDGARPRGMDAVHVRMYRTRLSDVMQSGAVQNTLENLGASNGSEAGGSDSRPADDRSLPASLLKPKRGTPPHLALDRDFRLTEADREGFYYQRLRFGTLPAGLYLTQVEHGKRRVCTWILVTDTALVLKRAPRQIVVYAVDMKTGTPLPNADIRAYRAGKVVAEKPTDARGLAEMSLPEKGDGDESDSPSRLTMVAVRGEDEAIVERGYYSAFEENGKFTVHAYTDRPIYRPGQRIYYKGIVRRALEPGVRYSVPAGEPVAVEIRDPNNERILRQRSVANRFGSIFGYVDLSPEARTGVYTLVTSVRGEKSTHDIVIASYQKPEFEVKVTPGKKTYLRGETIEMTVSAQFYFGAPVAGAKVDYYVYRRPDWAAEFPDDYEYGEAEDTVARQDYHEDRYRGETQSDGSVRLDENGKAVLRIPANTTDSPDSPQDQVLSVNVTVEDESKRQVSADGEAHVAAGDYHLAVRPDGYVTRPGQPSGVTLIARNNDGTPAPNVRVNLESGFPVRKDQEYTYKVFDRQSAITGPDGRVTVIVTPPHTGELRLNASASDTKGRAVRARAYLWAAGDDGGDTDTEYADLSLLTDKRRYLPGETARVLINAGRTGQTALLTVEGQRVYRTFLVALRKRSTVVMVPVLPEYGPNVTLAACYVKEKGFARSDIPLRVTVPKREVKVTITPDRVAAGGSEADLPRYHPRDTVTYRVQTRDAQGRPVPCEFSFGVVDESIYALKEDDPTALRDAFYPRRTNSVQTEYSFAVENLGDADKAEPQTVARKEFPDTVFWRPCLQTDAQGAATVRVPLKDNLTTWRATAIVQTIDSAFGRETDKILAAKEFFVRVETPRFLTGRDQSRLLALVHNDTGVAQEAIVRLRLEGLTTPDSLTQNLSVPAGGAREIAWSVTAGDADRAKIDVHAWTPRPAGMANVVQYADRVETSIPIRAHGREDTKSVAGELIDREEHEEIRLDPSSIPRETRLNVRITPSVASSLVGGLDYLIGYPYGCTEQTMSRFLPDVLVHRVLRLNPAALTGGEGGVSAAQLRALPAMVRDGLTRLARFQHKSSGAWGWWETDADDAWMTAYVLYGLATAQQAGYPVGKTLLTGARKGATGLLAKTTDADDKAFLLYALALAGDAADLKTVRIVRRNLRIDSLAPAALAYVVLMDRRLGSDGREALTELQRRAVSNGGMLYWQSKQASYHGWDRRMVTAAGLRALLSTDRSSPAARVRINAVVRWLMTQRTGEYWEDTRATSWVLAALCDYLEGQPGGATPTGTVIVKLNGQPIRSIDLTPEMAQEPDLVVRIPRGLLQPGKNDVALARTGGGSTIFYSVELRQTIASEDMAAYSPSNITIKREYLRRMPKKAGTDYWTLQTEPTNNRLHTGDRLLVRLTIQVPSESNYVLIEDPFPAGCEVTERGTADETTDWAYWWSSVDVRDDRIAFFARTLHKGKQVIEYNLRAQTTGAYHTLPTFLQAMYDPDTKGYSAETRVEVR